MAQTSTAMVEPIVLIHGFPFSQTMWSPLVSHLPEFNVLTPDLPGTGDSGAPSGYGSIEACAGLLMRFLDANGVEKATLGGLSMGGYVAFEMIRRYRERISGLILMNTKADADNADGKAARNQAIELVVTKGPGMVAESMMPKLLAEETAPEMEETVRGMFEADDPVGMVYALEAMRDRSDSTDLLPSIDVPALVISGTADRITPPDGMRRMAEKIPQSTFVEVPGTGHLTPIEKPEVVADIIKDWFSEQRT